MIDLSQLLIPPKSAVPEPTADEWDKFILWMTDLGCGDWLQERCIYAALRRCRELEAAAFDSDADRVACGLKDIERIRELEAKVAGATNEREQTFQGFKNYEHIHLEIVKRQTARIAELERDIEAMKAGFLEIQGEYAKLEAKTPVHLSTKLSLANHRIAELEAEVERLKNKKCVHELARDWSKETTSDY